MLPPPTALQAPNVWHSLNSNDISQLNGSSSSGNTHQHHQHQLLSQDIRAIVREELKTALSNYATTNSNNAEEQKQRNNDNEHQTTNKKAEKTQQVQRDNEELQHKVECLQSQLQKTIRDTDAKYLDLLKRFEDLQATTNATPERGRRNQARRRNTTTKKITAGSMQATSHEEESGEEKSTKRSRSLSPDPEGRREGTKKS
jgi:predicted nuclease with TOPRIM domain